MKWSITVKKNEDTLKIYENEVKSGWHSELCGLRKWRVVNVVPARSIESGMECYFIELQGSFLYYLEHLYLLGHKWKSNSVIPYWLSERHVVKT